MCCENHSHPTRFGCTRGEIVEAAGTAGRKRTNSRTNSKMCGSRTREHRSRQHLDDAQLLKTVSSPDRRLRLFGASTAIHWGSLSSTRFVEALWRRRASLPAARPHRSVAVNGSLVIRRSNDWPARECRSVSATAIRLPYLRLHQIPAADGWIMIRSALPTDDILALSKNSIPFVSLERSRALPVYEPATCAYQKHCTDCIH